MNNSPQWFRLVKENPTRKIQFPNGGKLIKESFLEYLGKANLERKRTLKRNPEKFRVKNDKSTHKNDEKTSKKLAKIDNNVKKLRKNGEKINKNGENGEIRKEKKDEIKKKI